VECPVTKPWWREMLKNKLVPHLEIKRAFALFQNLYNLYLDLVFFHLHRLIKNNGAEWWSKMPDLSLN